MNRALLFSLCVWLSAAGAGGPPANLRLSQARLAIPVLAAYLDVRDTDGNRIADLNPGQFTASLGETKLPVEQIQAFEQTGEGVAYIFLVDISLSVKPSQFATIRAALSDWADALTGRDRMAVLEFGETVGLVADFTADKAALKQKILALKPVARQTALHQGLIQAMQLGQRADADLPWRRVIVVLSDGLDDMPGGPTRNEVLRQMESDRVPVYAMGLDRAKADGKREEGVKALGLFARSSGGDYVGVGGMPLGQAYAKVRERIKAVTVARLDCRGCPTDGRIQRLQITLQDGGLALSDGVDLRALPPLPPQPNTTPEVNRDGRRPGNLAGYYFGGAALMLLAAFLAARRKRAGKVPLPPVLEEAATAAAPSAVAASPGAMPPCRVRLVAMGGRGQGKNYVLEIASESVIGRADACSVSIPGDTEISNRHCALSRKGTALFLRDLGSTNGTRVNGVPIATDYRLQEGDIIGIGRIELRFLLANKDT